MLEHRSLIWYSVNGGFIVLFLFVYSAGYSLLLNVLVGISWAAIILSFLLLSDLIIKLVIHEGGLIRSVPNYISLSTDIFIAYLFFSGGYIITCFFWLIQMFIQERAFLLTEH